MCLSLAEMSLPEGDVGEQNEIDLYPLFEEPILGCVWTVQSGIQGVVMPILRIFPS